MKKTLLFFLFIIIELCANLTFAQDSLEVLTFKEFLKLVATNHPYIKQANLLSETARQELRLARGAFEPVFESKYYRKSFKGSNYFSLWENKLRVPIWYGVDLLAGYENNGGPNINPEDITTENGLSSIGLSIPLGQGLLIDERRATLRQARFLSDIAEAEQIKAINKLLLEAAKQYWEWVFAYENLLYTREGLEFARFRLTATKVKAMKGAIASIDTVEAEVLVQDFIVEYEKAQLKYNNTTLILSTFIWSEAQKPLEIPENVVPSTEGWEIEPIQADSLERLVNLATANHPELVKNRLKIRQLKIQRRYYADQFLPKLRIDANVLSTGFNVPKIYNPEFIGDNHKIGVSFVQPLFLRNARGQQRLAEIKIRDANYELLFVNQDIIARVKASFNEYQSLQKQILAQAGKVRNYVLLREAEEVRFDLGTGTLFLINKRETSLVEGQIKLAELRTKYAKNKFYLQWASGRIQIE